MRLTDHLTDLLSPVRDLHVAALLETMASELQRGADVDAEPVERDAEGRIRRRGALDLPTRQDLRVRRDGRTLLRRVPGQPGLRFAPIRSALTELAAVHIGPFDWSDVTVRAHRAAGQPNWTPLRRWFLEWFQARFGEESPDLLGVVHRLDGPQEEDGGWRFTIDLGSASVAGFIDLLAALGQSGCAEFRIGETQAAA